MVYKVICFVIGYFKTMFTEEMESMDDFYRQYA